MNDAIVEMVGMRIWFKPCSHFSPRFTSLIFLFASYELVGSIGGCSLMMVRARLLKISVDMAESLGRMTVFVIGAFVIAGVVGLT